jgi:hypothetical protein
MTTFIHYSTCYLFYALEDHTIRGSPIFLILMWSVCGVHIFKPVA